MPEEPHPFFRSGPKLVLLLLLLAGSTNFIGLNSTDLWAPDEPRYAEVAREMMERGDYVLPHLDGQPYPHKPPLYFWLIAATARATGGEVNCLTARIPAATMGIACVLLTYLIGKLLWSRAAGFLGACALAVSTLTLYLSRRGNIDTTVTAFTTLALYALARNAFAERPRFGWDLVFFAACGFTVLTKGPVVFVPLGTALCLSIVAGQKRAVTAGHVAGTLLCAVVFLGICVAWLAPACVRGGWDYTADLLFKQTVERFEHPWAHQRPFHYYFVNFPWCFLPWTLPFLCACWHLVVDTKQEDRRPVVFLFVWFVVVFAGFTSSHSKREVYLLPLMPAAALIVGKMVTDTAFRSAREPIPRRLSMPMATTAVLFLLMGVGLVACGIGGETILRSAFKANRDARAVYEAVRAPVAWIGAGLVGGFGFTLFALAHRRGGLAFALPVVTLALAVDAGALAVLPGLNPYKSARELATDLARLLKKGDQVAEYSLDEEGFLFYLHHGMRVFETKDVGRLVSFLDEKGTKYLLVAEDDYEKSLAGRKDLSLQEVGSQVVGHRRLRVFRVVR